jgi:hypothetical protein
MFNSPEKLQTFASLLAGFPIQERLADGPLDMMSLARANDDSAFKDRNTSAEFRNHETPETWRPIGPVDCEDGSFG